MFIYIFYVQYIRIENASFFVYFVDKSDKTM